jgi:hypothetical protein
MQSYSDRMTFVWDRDDEQVEVRLSYTVYPGSPQTYEEPAEPVTCEWYSDPVNSAFDLECEKNGALVSMVNEAVFEDANEKCEPTDRD